MILGGPPLPIDRASVNAMVLLPGFRPSTTPDRVPWSIAANLSLWSTPLTSTVMMAVLSLKALPSVFISMRASPPETWSGADETTLILSLAESAGGGAATAAVMNSTERIKPATPVVAAACKNLFI